MLISEIRSAAQAAMPRVLERGDLVFFAFPAPHSPEHEEPPLRACLVLDTQKRAGRLFLTLAPGEEHPPALPRGYEIAVSRRLAVKEAGLSEAHMFYADQRLTVAATHPGFGPRMAPWIIGALDRQGADRMNAVRARIQALRDIAAERRRERQRERWGDQGAPRRCSLA